MTMLSVAIGAAILIMLTGILALMTPRYRTFWSRWLLYLFLVTLTVLVVMLAQKPPTLTVCCSNIAEAGVQLPMTAC